MEEEVVLSREEFEAIIRYALDGKSSGLLAHDAEQRAYIAELEAKLRDLSHIGTGAGVAVYPKIGKGL